MSRVTSIIRADAAAIVEEMAPTLEAFAGTTLLITGAAGFLCSYFLDVIAAFNDRTRDRPCRVIAIDNLKTGVADRVAHLRDRGDIELTDHDARLTIHLDRPPDWIVHGASIASPTFYRRYPLDTIDVNVQGTRHMLDLACRGARGMLLLSTSEIYGDPDPSAIPTREDYRGLVSCTGPRACYDESKRLAETLCTTYYRLHGTPVKIVRPFNVYGPGQRLDDCRIIPDLMSAALAGGPLVLYSDGRATRAFCYIRDAIRGMFLVLTRGSDGEPYNVGNDEEEISIAALVDRMASVAGLPPSAVEFRKSADPQYLTDNPRRRCPDLTRLRELGGWSPTVSLREGLDRTLTSYRESARVEATA